MLRFRPAHVFVILFCLLMTVGVLPPPALSQPEKPEPRHAEAEAFLSNNLLRIYINERESRVWEYQYAPGAWGEQFPRTVRALYTHFGHCRVAGADGGAVVRQSQRRGRQRPRRDQQQPVSGHAHGDAAARQRALLPD